MVNFKVSRGANSLSGNAAAPDISDKKYVNKKTQKESQDVVSLKVVALEKWGLTNSTYDCLLPTSAFSVL